MTQISINEEITQINYKMNYLKNLVSSSKFRSETETGDREWTTSTPSFAAPNQIVSDKRINAERISQRLEDLSESSLRVHADAIKAQDLQSFYANLFTDLNSTSQMIIQRQLHKLKEAQSRLEEEGQQMALERQKLEQTTNRLSQKEAEVDSFILRLNSELGDE